MPICHGSKETAYKNFTLCLTSEAVNNYIRHSGLSKSSAHLWYDKPWPCSWAQSRASIVPQIVSVRPPAVTEKGLISVKPHLGCSQNAPEPKGNLKNTVLLSSMKLERRSGDCCHQSCAVWSVSAAQPEEAPTSLLTMVFIRPSCSISTVNYILHWRLFRKATKWSTPSLSCGNTKRLYAGAGWLSEPF